jgi:glycosyltransferase involved in cell wall biosynthesis
MRVLVFTNMYPTPTAPHYGSFVRDEVRALRRAGVEVDVYFVNGRANKLNYLSMPAGFFARLRSRKYHLVHVHHSYCGAVATLQSDVPVVWTFHEGAIASVGNTIDQRWSKRLAYSKALMRHVAHRVDALVAVSQHLPDMLQRRDATVLPSGIDLTKFTPMDPGVAKRKLGLASDKRYVLFPSSPSRPEKRYELARRAVERLKDHCAGARDVELIALDEIPHGDVPYYVNAADAVLMTSAFEASPITIREALACNVPVVSTAVGDVPSLLDDIAGCHVTSDNVQEIAQALHGVFSGPRRIQSRGEMFRYSIDAHVEALLDVYRKTASRKRKRDCVAFVRHCYYAPYELKVKREADALQRAGYQARVICLRNRGERRRDVIEGVEVHRMPLQHKRGRMLRYLYEYNAFFLLASMKLAWWRVRHRLRVVQVHTMPDYLVFCALLPKLTGVNVVLHLHEPMPELFGTIFQRRTDDALVQAVKLAQRASIGFADRATTVTREMMQTFGRHGSNMEKITVVLNVPDDRLFRLSDYEHLRRRAVEARGAERPRTFRVFTHGAVEERYGVDTIVRAIALLKGEVPPFEFRFMGKGDYVNAILTQAKELRVENRVHYLGFVPFEKMIEEIVAADVCVVAMKKNEYSDLVHTNKMFEYIALRRPIVASRLDSTVSYFPDDCFVYFNADDPMDLAEKLRYVATHPDDVAARVDAASRHYDMYRWEHERRKYLGVYEDLLGVRLAGGSATPAPNPSDDREERSPVAQNSRVRTATGR